MINIKEKVPLSGYSTMRLGGPAAYLALVHSAEEIAEVIEWAEAKKLPFVMIGGGSNIIWPDEGYAGLVLVNKISGWETKEIDDKNIQLKVGAGEVWDKVIERSVDAGLSGIEQLSLIPGATGATPVQNVGAYGRELSEVLANIEAYDTQAKKMITLAPEECGFAYRTSRFRTTDKGRFLITSITMALARSKPQPPFYPEVQAYFDEHKITDYTGQNLREAVIYIRSHKLPDPAKVANCGSFFYNPIIDLEKFKSLQSSYPDIPNWPQPDGKVKISGAWLIEQAGLKGYRDEQTGMAIWPTQALTFINEHARSTADVLAFKKKVADKVKEMFNIVLEQEPELVKSV